MNLIKYQIIGGHRIEQRQDMVLGVPVWTVYVDGNIWPLTFDEAIERLKDRVSNEKDGMQ